MTPLPDLDDFLETPAWQQLAHRLAADTADRGEASAPTSCGVSPLADGSRIGPYIITGFIGSGGMGEVYDARDTRLGRSVAIKRLPRARAADAERVRLFEQEARSAAALTHPNVIDIHDIGTHEGCPYLVTERLAGETLRARLDRGPMTIEEVLDVALQLAKGLAAVHSHGIVHGDIKPQNVAVCRDGTVKLLDFGLARSVAAGPAAEGDEAGQSAGETRTIRGTAGYIAPEHLAGAGLDHRADLFAFGCVLFEMLTGTMPKPDATATESIDGLTRRDPPGQGVADRRMPHDFGALVRRCLEKDPAARIASADEIADALRSLAAVRQRPGGRRVPLIVATILLAIIPASSVREETDEARLRKRNPAAYEEYVRGMALSHSFLGAPDRFEAARAHYQAALGLDPGYPLALVGLADLELMYYVRGFDASPARIARSEALFHEALATAPDLAPAYYGLGSLLGWARRDFGAAVTAFETGIRLEPSGKGWAGLAWALASLQPPRSIEAERAARAAIRLEHDYEYAYLQLARSLRQQGRHDDAITALEDAIRIQPLFQAGYALLARIHLDRRDWRRALAVLDAVPAGVQPGVPNPAEPDVVVHSLQAYRAAAYAGLGDGAAALAALEIALACGYRDWTFLDRTTAFERLRQSPAFENLLKTYR